MTEAHIAQHMVVRSNTEDDWISGDYLHTGTVSLGTVSFPVTNILGSWCNLKIALRTPITKIFAQSASDYFQIANMKNNVISKRT